MMSSRSRPPFTATQWEELEHQALIFKYIISGVSIPPDLLFPFKRSLDSSKFFHHQSIGWGCIQMGLGRKIDPEPGRCRRTDGKKWRCSKEASPDSKYCERHMHRGRNRSRKPVEILATTTPTNPATISSFNTNLSPYSHQSSSLTSDHSQHHHQHPYNNYSNSSNPNTHPFLYPHSSSSRPPDHHNGFSITTHNSNNTSHLVSDSGFYSEAAANKGTAGRSVHGLNKEELDERSFFSEASGNLRSVPDLSLDSLWKCAPLRQQEQQQQQQHCFVLGTDFKSSVKPATKVEKEVEEADHQQPLRHFFDEWPLKSRDSWMTLEEERMKRAAAAAASYSTTTQLSISIPMPSHQDFTSLANSRSTSRYHDG